MNNIIKKIVVPSAAYRAAFFSMAYDYRDGGELRYYREIIKENFEFGDYLTRLRRHSLGVGLDKGLIRYATYWLVDEKKDVIYGVSRLRHTLSEVSLKEGGHIGYDVPPSRRNDGNATELLRQTLVKAGSMGIKRVLMTCDSDNIASARVIEKNGGVLENRVISDYTRKFVCRYWINT